MEIVRGTRTRKGEAMIQVRIRGKVLGLCVVSLTLIFAACDGTTKVSTNQTVLPHSTATTAPVSAPVNPQDSNASIEELPFASINHLVNMSDAGVIGEVSLVSSPRWNSPSGAPWTFNASATDSYRPVPLIYRDVTVVVSQVLFSNANLPVKAGDTITVLISGDGTNSGASIDGQNGLRWNQVDGTFSASTEELLLLKITNYPFSDSEHSETMLTQNRNSHWEISGSMAVSDVPGRSVDASALTSRILLERSKGLQQPESGADSTMINPLG